MVKVLYPELSYKIIGYAMQVHNELGSGFLEKVYENALKILFDEDEFFEAKQQSKIQIYYHTKIIGNYIADMVINNKIILELKTVENINDIHRAQVMNYLKATDLRLGMILNFGKKSFEFERFVM